MDLYTILVPCRFEDNKKPVRTKHHKKWDEYVRRLSGGLTILSPSKGQWVDKTTGVLYNDRVIPVQIACDEKNIKKIAEFTLKHYRQIAIMYYRSGDKVTFVENR